MVKAIVNGKGFIRLVALCVFCKMIDVGVLNSDIAMQLVSTVLFTVTAISLYPSVRRAIK